MIGRNRRLRRDVETYAEELANIATSEAVAAAAEYPHGVPEVFLARINLSADAARTLRTLLDAR